MRLPRWHRRQDADLDDELQSHLRMAIQDRIDRGESPEQAAAAARREFGNVLLVKETVRDMWGWTPIEQFGQDLGYARRALARTPAFTTRGRAHPRPRHRRQHGDVQRRAGRGAAAVAVRRSGSAGAGRRAGPARRRRAARRRRRGPTSSTGSVRTQTLDSMAAYHQSNVTVTGLGPSQHVPAAVVSATLFSTLGVAPALGRGFVAADERVGADVVVISDEFRRTLLGARPDPVGTCPDGERPPVRRSSA